MEWLRKKRTNAGMTQEKIAALAEISRGAYANIESGGRRPSVAVAKRIAAVLEFDWTTFFNSEPPDGSGQD